jgi:hypothetical protein
MAIGQVKVSLLSLGQSNSKKPSNTTKQHYDGSFSAHKRSLIAAD